MSKKQPTTPAFDRIPPDAKAEFNEALKFIAECPYKGTAIKFELEAQLNREGDDEYCEDCDDGSWFDEEANEYVDCESCGGTGYYSHGGDWNEQACQSFILSHIPAKVQKALIFSEFYNDGSVDSEFTFTLPLAKAAYALYVVEAFNMLAEEIGHGLETYGAGMHTAILNNPEGRYGRSDWNTLDNTCTHNFQQAMYPLLPALYFLASPDHKARGLSYRGPSIAGGKSSAIGLNNGVFEYRVFETCYQRPLAIIDNVIVIAKTLRFYKPEPTDTRANIGQIGIKEGSGLDRFYFSIDHIKALKHGLSFLKPDYKSVTRLEMERAFKVDEGQIALQEMQRNERWRREFAEVKTRRKYERRRVYHQALANAYQAQQDGNTQINPVVYAKEQLEQRRAELKGSVKDYVKEQQKRFMTSNCSYKITV